MAKKLIDGRKPGSGLNHPKKEKKTDFYKIYGLIDPRTDDVMYIGKTKNYLCKRLQIHLNGVRRIGHTSEKDKWIKELLELGMKPIIKDFHIYIKDYNEAKLCEQKYIEQFGKLNHNRSVGLEKVRSRKNYKMTTEQKKQVVELYKQKMTAKNISEQLSIPQTTIVTYLYRMGFRKSITIRRETAFIKSLMNNCLSIKGISSILNLNVNTIARRLREDAKKNNNEKL